MYYILNMFERNVMVLLVFEHRMPCVKYIDLVCDIAFFKYFLIFFLMSGAVYVV